ncbi:conserved hypothetical protein [Culex quinquefasciatus]|uniref:DNA ligase ATP-dependent N-terminal domain-containing protein n=1 Tax=Culex quinquefasciatus TaxID=7176 RepID=B0X7R8_CULQU|nr:conserved hypothetical protein [Culex quinquefasciatus]|eukprot:XP_001865690.1 conserved hypothetical protein [Culex quinquefasciatus]
MEASSTEEPAAGTPSSVKKSPSDSIPGGGEKCIESPDPDRVHGSFKSAEKKTFTVVKKEQPEVKREPSESPKRRTTGRSTIREKVLAKGRNGDVLGANVTDHRAAADDRDSGQLLLLGGSDSESGRSAGECVLKLEPAYLAPAQSTGRSLAQILMDAQTTRDLGLVAEQSKSSYRMMFRPAPHAVNDVFGKLRKINKMTGTDDGQDSVDVWAGLHGLVWWSSPCYGVRQPDCTVAAGGRGGLPGGQVFDDAGNTVEVHVGASDQGRSGSVGAIRREGFKCELKYDGDRALFHLLKDGSVNIYSWN